MLMRSLQLFQSKTPMHLKRKLSMPAGGMPLTAYHISPMWAGIACTTMPHSVNLGVSISDSTYCIDYSCLSLQRSKTTDNLSADIECHVMNALARFSKDHISKFVGVGVATSLLEQAPNICTKLWLELDIVPIVFNISAFIHEPLYESHHLSPPTPSLTPRSRSVDSDDSDSDQDETESSGQHLSPFIHVPNTLGNSFRHFRSLDEQSDTAARKCVMYFGPGNNPRLWVGSMNQVHVDAGGKIHLIDDMSEYEKTVSQGTWNAVMKFAQEVKGRNIKMGFFSSTPQGGGVALMRHALIRFLHALDVQCEWYVAKPSPTVFRITKNNHNILQGVAPPSARVTNKERELFDIWIQKNGAIWLGTGGPLAQGGIDIAFIDDAQMVGLIPMIRKARPSIPIIYRSHIEIRSDLTKIPGSPQAEVWDHLYKSIKEADMFISHPIAEFVPTDIPKCELALLPAATDMLDGLNKQLSSWDSQYYMGMFRDLCVQQHMTTLEWPARDYFVQIARFDPAKGLPNAIDAYCRFRKLSSETNCESKAIPQLLLCGHGAVDDPDASIIYDQIMILMETEAYRPYAKDIVVMRLPPSDQLLNALLANSRVALQLSTSEGFEVKVSEALHAGKPVIAFAAGGIPLQIRHGMNGFLACIGDNQAVAKYLLDLFMDEDKYQRFSDYAKTSVPDEVTTVGNAAAWLYLAAMCTRVPYKLRPVGAWLNDLLREAAEEPYTSGEPRLVRKEMS